MRQLHTRVAVAFVAVLLLTTAPGVSPSAATAAPGTCAMADGQDPRPHCCFVNPSYAGTCEMEPAKDETCDTILQYLNNPMSQGKSYCNGTSIRGGWKSVPCDPKMQQD
jgi:hypothetical protein